MRGKRVARAAEHGGTVGFKDDKVPRYAMISRAPGIKLACGSSSLWIYPYNLPQKNSSHPFPSFYISYLDEKRPRSAPMGLASIISFDLPVLGWIRKLKYTRVEVWK